VHVALVRNRHDAVEALFVADRTEGRGGEHLRLSALEQAGTVNARQVADLRPDRPDLVGLRPSGRNFSSTTMTRSSSSSIVLMILSKSLLFLSSSAARTSSSLTPAFSSAVSLESFANAVLRSPFSTMRIALATSFLNVLRVHASSRFVDGEQRIRPLFLADFFLQLVDRGNDLFDRGVAELYSTEEIFLGDFMSAAFDHHHAVERAGDDDVHAAGFILRQRGVDDVLAVLIAADAYGGDVLGERDVGNGKRGTCAAYGEHVGVEFAIDREHGRHDHDVVAEAVFEERTDRTIHLTGAQGAVLGGTSFALDVAARDLARGIHLLFKFAGQGKEIDARAGLLRGGDGGKDNVRIAVADENTAVGLLSKLAGLDRQGATPISRETDSGTNTPKFSYCLSFY